MLLPTRQLACLFASCSASLAAAAGEAAGESATRPLVKSGLSVAPDPISMTSLWQLTLGMLLVLALIAGIAWLLKRTGRFQVSAGGGLRILGGLSMGTRERVVLLQVGETQLLVGVAPGRVQTLHVLEHPLPAAGANPGSTGFAEQLGRLLKKEQAS